MSQLLEVFVPCDVLTVKVRVGPSKALSTLEELFLTAVLKGISSFEELAGIFGIGRRPTLDLVFDLWQKGYVVVDLTQGAVLPSATISLATLPELHGAEEAEEPWPVMLDRLTAQVMPVGGLAQLPEGAGGSVVPVEAFEVGLHDVTTAGLLGALRRVIEREEVRNGGEAEGEVRRNKKVLGAHLSLTQQSRTSQRRWLPMHIQCSRGGEGEGVQVVVVDSELPAEARATAARRLGQILEEQPESDFAKFLEASASSALVRAPSLMELLGRLEAAVATLLDVPSASWKQRHDQLLEITEAIDEIVAERRNAEVDVEILNSQAEQVKELTDLVQGASRQVVIASTWIYLDEIEHLVPVLRDRLEHGVQCFVLWGFKPDDELPLPIRNALLPLRTRYPALFFLAERSCREHAKLVIQDDRRALISSMSALRPSEARTFEAGVVLSAREGFPCAPIEAALQWARETYPDFLAAQGLYTSYEEFHSGTNDREMVPLLSPPPSPVRNSSSGMRSHEALDAVTARLWQMAWQNYALAVRRLDAEIGTTARLLRDGEHRDVLWQALKNAERRLLITSDRLGPEVLNERFIGQLRERLEAGVFVALVYRRFASPGDPRLEDVKRHLATLREFRHFRCVEADNHSKILVWDETAVIGSFNFLSFSGYYLEGRPSLRRRQRSEVGALIPAADVADRILEVVGTRLPEVIEGWDLGPPQPRASLRTETVRTQGNLDYGELLAALSAAPDERGQGEVLRKWVAAAADPWELLDSLQAAGLPAGLQRVAAASALSGDWHVGSTDPHRRWLLWLAEDLWEQKHLVEAAVLTSAGFGAQSQRLPRPPLVLLAAMQAIGRPAPIISELAQQLDLTLSERFVVAGVALVDLALRGTYESLAACEQLRSALPPVWASVAASFKEYWDFAWQALPMRSIRSDMESEHFRRQLEEGFQELAALWSQASETRFKFISGTKTHEWLFDLDKPFGVLGRLIQNRDAEGIRAWVQGEDGVVPGVDRVAELIDYATEQVDPGRPIKREKRVSYEGTLNKVVAAARELGATAGTSEEAKESHLVRLAAEFGSALAAVWKGMEVEVLEVREPERAILIEAMKELRLVADWASR